MIDLYTNVQSRIHEDVAECYKFARILIEIISGNRNF